jgi:hypothetical protein
VNSIDRSHVPRRRWPGGTATATDLLPAGTIHGQDCNSIQGIGQPGYANADGVVSALRVQQYKAVCNDVWKRFVQVSVSDAFVNKGYWFQASGGLRVTTDPVGVVRGWFTSVKHDDLVFSIPVDVSQYCTLGIGKVHWVRNDTHYERQAVTANGQGPGC